MKKPVSHILKAENINTFLFGGFAYITVESQVTGKRFTYRLRHAYKKDPITKKPTRELDRNSPLMVGLLTGNINTKDYTYIGFVKNGEFIYDKRSKIGSDVPSVQVLAKLVFLANKNEIPTNANVYHEGRCGKCGVVLTTPESIETGIGPVCVKNMGETQEQFEERARQKKVADRKRKIAMIPDLTPEQQWHG